MSTASNIKDRVNRQSVIRILNRISENINPSIYERGVFIFIGINEYSEEILEIIEPPLESKLFYYNCSDKFKTDIFMPYFNNYKGSIVFVSGDECIIYEFLYDFRKKKHISANLIKRHKKGGQSSLRFSRLAEESRLHYVTHIIDYIKTITDVTDIKKSTWIFGSDEIRNMVLDRIKDIKIKDGGFLEFNEDTIKDRSRWISYLDNKDEDENISKVLDEIVYRIDTDPDFLDFDFDRRNDPSIKYYIINNNKEDRNREDKEIVLYKSYKYYDRLSIFPYIAIKWYKMYD